MTQVGRCDRCGAALRFITERVVGPEHIHREYECSGCLRQFSACSTEGFRLVMHTH